MHPVSIMIMGAPVFGALVPSVSAFGFDTSPASGGGEGAAAIV